MSTDGGRQSGQTAYEGRAGLYSESIAKVKGLLSWLMPSSAPVQIALISKRKGSIAVISCSQYHSPYLGNSHSTSSCLRNVKLSFSDPLC